MAAHLLILINSETAQVVNAMITSQGAGSMSAVPRGHAWAELYQDNSGNFDRASARILELLVKDIIPAWSFVIPFLAKRIEAELGQLISSGYTLAPTSESIKMSIQLVLKYREKVNTENETILKHLQK